jgi:hypothetical protein
MFVGPDTHTPPAFWHALSSLPQRRPASATTTSAARIQPERTTASYAPSGRRHAARRPAGRADRAVQGECVRPRRPSIDHATTPCRRAWDATRRMRATPYRRPSTEVASRGRSAQARHAVPSTDGGAGEGARHRHCVPSGDAPCRPMPPRVGRRRTLRCVPSPRICPRARRRRARAVAGVRLRADL